MFNAAAGERETAAFFAGKTLALSARYNYCQSFLVAYDIFQPILQIGLEQGIEIAFIQKVLARIGKRAAPFLTKMAQHSNPKVRCRIIPPIIEVRNEQTISILGTYDEGSGFVGFFNSSGRPGDPGDHFGKSLAGL